MTNRDIKGGNMDEINQKVREHETGLLKKSWTVAASDNRLVDMQALADTLYHFFDLFNAEYFNGELPAPVITFKGSAWRNLGHFLHGRNDIGAMYEININPVHINRPLMEMLKTLLHEAGHLAQYVNPAKYGRHSSSAYYHNKSFCLMVDKQGIPCSSRGITLEIRDPFKAFCVAHGVEAIDHKIEGVLADEGGRSKLKKWVCGCGYAVRVAVSDFKAHCDVCGEAFRRAGKI